MPIIKLTDDKKFHQSKDANQNLIHGGISMGLRINTNVAALNAIRILRKNTLDLNKSLERLSSGLRINRAADDAAGLAIAEGFRSVVKGSDVSIRNAQDGISLIQTAEGALIESSNILQRIRELAVQSANGTNSDANRAALDTEVYQLLQQIDAIARDTEFNGFRMLSAPISITLQVGPYSGQVMTIVVGGAKTSDLGINGLSISTQTGAVAALSLVDNALKSINILRSNFGAFQNRLEFTINVLEIQKENAAYSESQIRDADIAQETIRFTRNQILVSAGTSVLAQANVIPQTALQLLRG